MNFIDYIITSIGERKLQKFRDKDTILKTEGFENYQKDLPRIETCYKNALYWHGTGRYHYHHGKTSRYEDIRKDSHLDILESIIESAGIRTHFDPWVERVEDISTETISVTRYRIYARLYACMHQYENEVLIYQYGTNKFWFYNFLLIQSLHKKFLINFFSHSLYRLWGTANFHDLQIWMSAVRSDLAQNSISPFKGYLLRSDISGNYPILIGIKKQGIIPFSFNPGLERLETRSKTSIPLKDITHIEVPLSKVEETKEFLEQRGVSIQVIPLEFGELYCSNFNFKELTYLSVNNDIMNMKS